MFVCNLANQAKNCNMHWNDYLIDYFTHAYCLEQNSRVAASKFPLTDATVTCCAVSILSFSMSSIWKPLRRTSSVEAGTVAVKGDCKDRDERLHKSSIGSCKVKQGCLSSEQHTHKPWREASRTARRVARESANPPISVQANSWRSIGFIKMAISLRSKLSSCSGDYFIQFNLTAVLKVN